ncbi:MAG: glycosyltransferase family 2 protein, partial [Pseudomonadota bacterium]
QARLYMRGLRSLIGDDPAMRDVQITVADGGSTDGTQDIVQRLAAEFPNVALIGNPARLQAAAINRVAADCAQSDHQVLVRCDAHSVYPPGYVLGVARALVAQQAASVTVPMDAEGAGCFQRALALITDTKLGSGGSAHRGGARSGWVDHGHHAGFDLSWYRRLGGYDESFSHNEDAEYDRRLTEAGGRIWMAADLRITIAPRGTPMALARQYWRYGRGRARTVLKHRMRPRLRQMIPVGHVLALGTSAILLAVHPIGWLYPAAYGALALGASLWSATRIGLCGLWAGVAVAVMHTAWGAGFLAQAMRGPGPTRETPPIAKPS